MIHRFRAQNYKALRDVTLELTPFHVLIGPNDSGKTSVLEALGALSRSAEVPLVNAFGTNWRNAELVWQHDPKLMVVLEADDGPNGSFGYKLQCGFQSPGRNVLSHREEARVGAGPWSEYPHGSSTTRACNLSKGFPPSVRASLAGARSYWWNPKLLALPVALDSRSQFELDSTGFGLPRALSDLLLADRARFQELEARLVERFPGIKGIELRRESGFMLTRDEFLQPSVGGGGNAPGIALYFKTDSESLRVPATSASDGVLIYLAYLFLSHQPNPPRLLLIEEPENGIHPKRLQEIVQILRDLITTQSQMQVLISTHSPYLLDLCRPEEVTLCRKGKDGAVAAHRLSESKVVKDQIDIFTLGEIWTNEGEDRIAASPVPTEARAQ